MCELLSDDIIQYYKKNHFLGFQNLIQIEIKV
jgi:hypothetical protein